VPLNNPCRVLRKQQRGCPPRLACLSPSAKDSVVDRPETRYARSDDLMIAYQVTGEGNPVDLVLAPGIVSHLDLDWDDPEDAR
jgi:hypothetical protein